MAEKQLHELYRDLNGFLNVVRYYEEETDIDEDVIKSLNKIKKKVETTMDGVEDLIENEKHKIYKQYPYNKFANKIVPFGSNTPSKTHGNSRLVYPRDMEEFTPTKPTFEYPLKKQESHYTNGPFGYPHQGYK